MFAQASFGIGNVLAQSSPRGTQTSSAQTAPFRTAPVARAVESHASHGRLRSGKAHQTSEKEERKGRNCPRQCHGALGG